MPYFDESDLEAQLAALERIMHARLDFSYPGASEAMAWVKTKIELSPEIEDELADIVQRHWMAPWATPMMRAQLGLAMWQFKEGQKREKPHAD